MWQVLWLSPSSSERTTPYVETSEQKLRDVGFCGTSSQSKEEIKNFQPERVFKQLQYILRLLFVQKYYPEIFFKRRETIICDLLKPKVKDKKFHRYKLW